MPRKRDLAEARQKESPGGAPKIKSCCTGIALNLLAALAMALACSFAYALLLVLSGHSCSIVDSPGTLPTSGAPGNPLLGADSDAPLITGENEPPSSQATSLGRIIFGIAATARLWERRAGYVKLWWRPNEMRGFVWLDEPVSNWSSSLPPARISGNTSRFRYTHRGGRRAAIRISRIVSETFRVGLPDVDWFVMGDDDTVFVPDNLAKLLSKYDHRRLFYIGSSSESHQQNLKFSFSMAYGGGGFAISYALAALLEKRHDECIQRYPFLYGSDDRMHACMAELGVPLTREPGFHQMDVYGDVSGLLSAHPISPLISIHHLDVINPVFPGTSQLSALRHLYRAVEVDPSGVLQQSVCYDRKRRWTISVSFGYMIKVFRGLKAPRDLETPTRTFMSWNRKYEENSYSFTTRPPPRTGCDAPVAFHMERVGFTSRDGVSSSNYTRSSIQVKPSAECRSFSAPTKDLRWISLLKERADDSWFLAPRRQCCHIITAASESLELLVRDCQENELIFRR